VNNRPAKSPLCGTGPTEASGSFSSFVARRASRCYLHVNETAEFGINPHAIKWMRWISRLDPNAIQWLAAQRWNKSVRHGSLPAETRILGERALVGRRSETVPASNLVGRSESSRSDTAGFARSGHRSGAVTSEEKMGLGNARYFFHHAVHSTVQPSVPQRVLRRFNVHSGSIILR
jgi:hypothetical protein